MQDKILLVSKPKAGLLVIWIVEVFERLEDNVGSKMNAGDSGEVRPEDK